MATTQSTDEIARQYGIASVPESVSRLGRLISRPDATTEEVAKLICQDAAFTAQLLRVANPRIDREADYTCTTVEDALQRTGMGCVLLVAMHEPLLQAVLRTFRTMLGIELKMLAAANLALEGEHLLCEIGFKGRATGAAALRLTMQSATAIAAGVLAMPAAKLNDEALINDVIGELGNMVVGNFQSNLCDAGLACKLTSPVITQTTDFRLRSSSGSLAQRIGFNASGFGLFVDMNVNPWSE